MESRVMRFSFAAALACALATSVVAGQSSRQVQIYANVVDAAGKPAQSLGAGDVTVKEDGVAATVTKVERINWPVKVQLLVDNGVGLGVGSLQPLKTGLVALLEELAAKDL